MSVDYQRELNAEQLEVVQHGDGPCLVLAGAGSGKTRTITYRVAYLLEQGVAPENILLVTFTNKAANEMIGRVQALSGGQIKLPWSGTFHHIAYKLLRQWAPLVGYKNNFTILDSDDSKALIKISLKKFKPDDNQKKFPSANVLQNIISYTRNAETAIEKVLEKRYPQWLEFAPAIQSIAADYTQQKQAANAMDFDDLLVNLLKLLDTPLTPSGPSPLKRGTDRPLLENSAPKRGADKSLLEEGPLSVSEAGEVFETVGDKYTGQFQYVLVDEYQDTNKIQASIIHKLAAKHKNILVVGDDAQSIYSFRAADINNILHFEEKYPGTKVFKLTTNYRSSQEILDVANEVIANNLQQYKKELKTLSAAGVKPTLQPQLDQGQEAEAIISRIGELIDAGTPARDIAVLFRASHHSQRLEMELVKAGINYDYRGGLRFFERAHIKDVLAYLRILNNLADTAAWLRVLLHEEGIGPAAAQKIIDRVKQAEQIEDIKEIGYEILGQRAKQGWHNFVQILEGLIAIGKTNVAELVEAVKESNYQFYLEAEYVDSHDRLKDIDQLADFARQYNKLEEFLAEASLQESYAQAADSPPAGLSAEASAKVEGGARGGGSRDRIVLSTVHQAKGLEWQAVFVINLASGAFPSDRAYAEQGGLEEERRLFYVAITRAKRHLHLSYPMAGGGWGSNVAGPSIFLEEIKPSLLEDQSLLSGSLVFNDDDDDIKYVSEDGWKPRPGSFLKDISDL